MYTLNFIQLEKYSIDIIILSIDFLEDTAVA